MAILKFILVAILLALKSINTQAQAVKTVYDINKQYQACLDKGVNMVGCAQLYYNQIDSLLNVVYNKLRKPMSPANKASLKTEQLNWLAKRDAYFRKVDLNYQKENKDGFAGNDIRMIALDNKAQFVRKRVIELLARLQ